MDKGIEIKINKLSRSITFINNGIVFSQFGIAEEILDLIINLQQETNRLNNELVELKKYKEEATRKHWQQKAAEHYMNEKLYEFKINDTIEYINNNRLSKFGSIDDKDADKIIKMLGGD